MLMNLCENIISEYCTGYTFEEKQGEYICILNLNWDFDKQQYFHIAQDIKDKVLIEYEFSVTIGIGMTVHNIINLHKSYMSASKALGQKLFIGKNQIIFADENEAEEMVVLNIDFRILDKLSTLLKIADIDSLADYLSELFSSIRMSSLTIQQCRSFLLQLYLTSLRVLFEIDLCSFNEINSTGNRFWEILFSLETIQDIQVFSNEYLADLCIRIHDKNGKKSKNIIHKIKEIIHSRYQENITIQDIAKEVYLTHTYICLVFRQETGVTINDYLTWYRVEKAKEMLVSNQTKLSEISRSIGYTDTSYFYKIFKKYTGVSPGKYREELAGNE
jgi:two-component system response regulator YesN